ncbi:DgyrCDS11000 [Dimorphilus gyrociliatus]|uniref:DgyrCDS11000 n=1 Tax=Dimorphilus gyrociliatus TaxID=2664684 RepID=A0A7I8W218_9ANNE|nr:DgyrCDS11000 [Dimorphilus gyrociliatus]
MPNSKKKRSVTSFGEFLKDKRQSLKDGGMSEEEVIQILLSEFKKLSEEEKEKYEERAKESRRILQQRQRNKREAEFQKRRDPFEVIQETFVQDITDMGDKFTSKTDVMMTKFYLINFQILCHMEEAHESHQTGHIPLEIGLLEFTLKDGITNQYHQFVKLEDIPYGISSYALAHSEIHKIPILPCKFGTSNYEKITEKIMNMVQSKDMIFTLASNEFWDFRSVQNSLNWIFQQVNQENLGNLKELARLFQFLITFAEPHLKPSVQDCIFKLSDSKYEYKPDTYCYYHCEIDTIHCALGSVRRWAYSLFETLCPLYGCEITKNHILIA